MFPKKYRFTARVGEDFFANAKRVYSPLFVLYIQTREDDQVKCAVIVPKKHAHKATERNKIKRKMRSGLLPYLEKITGKNLVLYLKQKVTEKNESNFEKEIHYLVKKIAS